MDMSMIDGLPSRIATVRADVEARHLGVIVPYAALKHPEQLIGIPPLGVRHGEEIWRVSHRDYQEMAGSDRMPVVDGKHRTVSLDGL
jgi:hypothetical protein